VRRAGLFSGALLLAGIAAGVLLVVTEFSKIAYVTTITASCSDFADPHLRDTCLTVGHESHHWAIGLLGIFVILMAFGAAVGRSRPAAMALLVAGLISLGITLLHDLPLTAKKGEVGIAFAEGKAHKGTGFWLELVGGALGLGAGGVMLTRLQRGLNSSNDEGPEAEPASS
jgi:hypothetical protein